MTPDTTEAMWDFILGFLALMVLQPMLVVVHDHWVEVLRLVQVSTGEGAIPRDQRQLMGWMIAALCLIVLEGIVYFGILFRLQVLIRSGLDHTVEILFWVVITSAISIIALVDVAFFSVWILQMANFLLDMMALYLFVLRYSAALRTEIRNGQDLGSDNLMSARDSCVDETSPLLESAMERLPILLEAVTSQEGYQNNMSALAWSPRDELIRKAIANASRSSVPTPPGPRLPSPWFKPTTTSTASSASSSGSDFGPCYIDSEVEVMCTTESSSKSAASAKSLPEFQSEHYSDEEELTILEQTMTI